MQKKELAVGDSTQLEIIFLTSKRNGTQTKSPTIQTNEGPPLRRVTISTTVVPAPDSTYPVTFKPYKLWVSRAGEVDVDEAKFEITNVSDADLEISLVGQPPGYFEVMFPEKVKAGESAECKLKVNPEFLSDAFEKSITFEFSDNAHSRFTVPVVRRFIGQGAQKAPSANPEGDGGGH